MITYFVLIIFVFVVTYNTRRVVASNTTIENNYSNALFSNKFAAILCSSALIIVSGFRYMIGTDYYNYIRSYEWSQSLSLTTIDYFDEPGRYIIMLVSRMIYNDPVTFFVISAIITITLVIRTIWRYSEDIQLSVALYIFIGAWHGSFNGIRQYIAASILFAGHRLVYERKFWKYLIVVLIAMAFHRTSIVMLPLYFILSRELNWKTVIELIIGIIVIRLSYDNLLSTMAFFKGSTYDTYSNMAYMNRDVNLIRVLVVLAPLIIPLLGYKTETINDKETRFYIMWVLVAGGLMIGTSGSAYLARITIYANMCTVIAMPKFLQFFSEGSRKNARIIILFLYFIYWIYDLYSQGILNFIWWFSHANF